MGTRIAKKRILEAIPESGGIMSIIAKKLGVSWSTADRVVRMYPETLQAYTDELERMIDLAESKLYDSIQKGDTQDVKWFLARKGKKRGYGESLELDNKGTQKVVIEYADGNSNTPPLTRGTDPDQAGTEEA